MVNNGLICNDGLYEMDFPLLEEQAADPDAKIMILCSPHNPVDVYKRQGDRGGKSISGKTSDITGV